MMKQQTRLAAIVALLLLNACDNSGVNVSGTDLNNSDRKLVQFDNSEAFFSALRDGLKNQANAIGGDVQLENGVLIRTDTGEDFGTSDGGTAGGTTSGTTGGTTTGSSTEDSSIQSSTSGSSGSSKNDVSETNVQVAGVDEQDRMKSDGEFLYILENNYTNVYAIEDGIGDGAQPLAEAVEISADDVSASSVRYPKPANSVVRVLSLQPASLDATPLKDISIDLDGRQAQGMYLYKSNSKRNLILTSSGFNYWGYWQNSLEFSGRQSLITKVDVTDAANPVITDAFELDGQIISSRRIENRLFIASRYYPQLKGLNTNGLSANQIEQAIDSASLSEALPKYTRSTDRNEQALVDPKGCFVAEKSDGSSYNAPDIVSLSIIDLDTMTLSDSECFLGSSETLYATPDSVYLATTRYDYQASQSIDFEDVIGGAEFIDPRLDTDIHQFAISESGLQYSGSGRVSGHFGWNPLRKPFRMSEKDGYLRVATFASRQSDKVSPINVTILNVEGDGDLVRVAELPNIRRPEHIGKPGEQLYASRFLGERAYLVTFRQTDPLYVVDLSKPADPFLAGELEIDGYSDYLQPIGENFVLGIGRDAKGQNGDGAFVQGIKLSLFNVTNPGNPVETDTQIIGERGSQAQALQNHRAITILPANETRLTRLAFGIDVAGEANARPVEDPRKWYPWSYTGLHGFEISTGSNAGISYTGVMQVETASSGGLKYGPKDTDDRAVISGDTVYYIHGSRVFVSDWNDMGTINGPR